MTDVVIAEAVRSAVGRGHKGSLAQRRPDELAAEVVAGLLARVPQVAAAEVEDVILGCAMPEGEQGLNIARVVGMLAGLGGLRPFAFFEAKGLEREVVRVDFAR